MSSVMPAIPASVHGEPTAVRCRYPVGDHRMSVQLGVESAAGVLTEHPDHDPLGVHAHDVTVAAHPGVGVGFDPAEHRVDSPVVSNDNLILHLFVAEGEQDRHRLGCREGGVVTANRALAIATTEVTARCRVFAGHHRKKRFGIDLTSETEVAGAAAPPAAGWLVTV